MASIPVESPRQPSFAEAMEITAQWLGLWENGELSDEVLADRVGELVASRDGGRGFFVVSLAGDCPLMDRLPDPLVTQLRAAGDGVVDLTARNLAMSTAMALHHQRADDAPAYFTMVIVGHVIVGGILALEKAYAPPTWVHLAIWLPLLTILTLLLLPVCKGMLVALQWSLRMHGFGGAADAPEPDPAVGVAAKAGDLRP